MGGYTGGGSGSGGGGGITAISEKTDDFTLDTKDTLYVLGVGTSANKAFTLPALSGELGNIYHVKNVSDYTLTLIGAQVATDAVEAGTTTTNVTATGHSAVVGNIFKMTSGDESGEERVVTAIVDADNFTISPALSGTPSATETFELREAIDADYDKTLTKNEMLSVYASDLTRDEWSIV